MGWDGILDFLPSHGIKWDIDFPAMPFVTFRSYQTGLHCVQPVLGRVH